MGEWKALKTDTGTGWKYIYREAGTGWKALEWEGVAVDVGAACISRGDAASNGYTRFSLNNRANANGTLTKLCIYTSSSITALHVGTFYQISGTTWKCRAASGSLGNFASGKTENIVIDLSVQTNDVIAFYNVTGTGVYWSNGSSDFYYTNANVISTNQQTVFNLSGSDLDFSCYAEG